MSDLSGGALDTPIFNRRNWRQITLGNIIQIVVALLIGAIIVIRMGDKIDSLSARLDTMDSAKVELHLAKHDGEITQLTEQQRSIALVLADQQKRSEQWQAGILTTLTRIEGDLGELKGEMIANNRKGRSP